MRIRHVLSVVLLIASCSKKSDSGGGGAKEERPAPVEIKIHKVEKLELVAPNQTYIDQGLAKKPAAGKIFVCVQYEATSKSDKPETLPPPNLTDGKGAKIDVSSNAAGGYLPADWERDPLGKLEPGKTIKRADCFEVATDATTGMSLGYVDTGWGPKFKPWHLSVPL